MPNHRRPRRFLVLGAVALSAFGLTLSLAVSVPAALAAGPANPEASELVRLINGERAHLGKAALRNDTFLAAKARDGAVACPNDATKVMAGRAKDFAVYGFPANAHLLRLCPSYTSMDAMASWGYRGARGEITALNGGYGTGKIAYAYGCSPSLRTCPGPATSTYNTTARAMTNWTSSASHYNIIVGSYDRVGCGAWVGSNGAFYYDCMFSRGGRVVPKAAARAPAAAATATASASPSPSDPLTAGGELATASLAPTSDPFSAVVGIVAAPTPHAWTQRGIPLADRAGTPALSRNLSVAAGAIAAILSLFYGLVLTIKRRRPRTNLAPPAA